MALEQKLFWTSYYLLARKHTLGTHTHRNNYVVITRPIVYTQLSRNWTSFFSRFLCLAREKKKIDTISVSVSGARTRNTGVIKKNIYLAATHFFVFYITITILLDIAMC